MREPSKARALPSPASASTISFLSPHPCSSSMDRWAKPSHRRGGRDNPSFSSSLLDAIYRSIDESDGGVREKHHSLGAPNPPLTSSSNKKQHTTVMDATAFQKPVLRRNHENTNLRYYAPVLTTSSSSDGSSYGGFSSDADSSVFPTSRPNPVRISPPVRQQDKLRPDLPPLAPEKKKSGSSSIRTRFRDMRKPRAGSAPASPGARIASFLNSLFTGNGSPKKGNIPSIVAGEVSACSSASSFTRSCLNKTPRSGGRKRTVRFGPVSVVDERRHSGRRSICEDGDLVKARESRRMVEELLRELGAAVEDGAESDSSSDLFELEIPVQVNGGGRRYRDELPVYETTHFPTNRAIAHGLVMY